MVSYDVIIVGAGPAGCVTTKYLSNNSHRVLLINQPILSGKPCGGLLVEESTEFLKDLSIPKNIFSHPQYLDLKFMDWDNELEFSEQRQFWSVDRAAFDQWLLEICRENGNTHCMNGKLVKIKVRKDYVELWISTGREEKILKCKYLVGADGSPSLCRSYLPKSVIRTYMGLQEIWRTNSNIDDFAYFIYDNSITDFFSWVGPKNGYLYAATATVKGVNKKFQQFKKKLEKKLGIKGTVFKKEAHTIYRPKSLNEISLGYKRILLIGEAAGLISPSTAEGISFALRSGFNCAKALNQDFDNALELYGKLCEPLKEELESKIWKAEKLSDRKKRLELFRSWNFKDSRKFA